MPKDDSPFTVGQFWLDKRRDGRSPEVWQIAWYDPAKGTTLYKSTKSRALDDAIAVICAHEAESRSKERNQPAEAVELLPHLFHYVREQGPDVKRLDTIKSSFRAWIGFLQQDELGTGITIAQIDKNFVNRFRRWRMGPHSWEVEWGDRVFKHDSPGVSGKSVQRNIEDLRAALHHGEANLRFTAPRLHSVDKKLIKKNPRQTLDLDRLGAIIGYASLADEGWHRELLLQLASGCRPGHAMKFDPAKQWHGETIDLQPWREDETDKRAAVLPAIPPLVPYLEEWKEKPHDPVKSRKRAQRTMRRVLGLPEWVEAYCIRTTVATHLDEQGTPGAQISGIIGHLPESRGVARTTGKHYLAYDPTNCERAVEVLTALFEDVVRRSEEWLSVHFLSTPLRGQPLRLERRPAKVVKLQDFSHGGR